MNVIIESVMADSGEIHSNSNQAIKTLCGVQRLSLLSNLSMAPEDCETNV